MLVDDGLAMIADTRTNAGVDNISSYRKLHINQSPGERILAVATAGTLSVTQTALAMLAGLAVLYAIGVPYMALIANAYLGKGLTFWQVIKNGMLIYLPGDLLKIALGSFLCVAITRRLPQVFAAA